MISVILKRMFRGLQFLLFLLVWPYAKVASFRIKKKVVPPIADPLLLMRASELAKLIREQKITSTEVVKAFIERIKMVNPLINSVVQDRFQAALLDAKAADDLISSNVDSEHWARTKPLLGVPMSFKETIGVKGMSNNGGRMVPESRTALEDCEAVSNLREAGAIPLVVTNTPELCLFWETYNFANGRTNNPYDTSRTTGGSSGGEAALLSAGGSVIGLGSDIAGSGRLPPMFCGCFGHKPTSRVVSVQGHMPDSADPDWSRFLVLAPLARYASDLSLVLRHAAPKEAAHLRLDEEVDLKKIRILYMDEYSSHLMSNVNEDMREAVKKCAMHFKKFGVEPVKTKIKNFDDSLEATVTLMLNMRSPNTVFQKSEDTEDWTLWDVVKEMFKKHLGCSKFTAYSIYFGLLKKLGEKIPKRRKETMKKLKASIQTDLDEMLGEDGVLILPVFTGPAHKHYRMYYKMLNTIYLSFFNLVELPATACPVGLNKKGLPIGVQIVANKYQDRLSLAVACEIERAFGGWVPPSSSVQINNNMPYDSTALIAEQAKLMESNGLIEKGKILKKNVQKEVNFFRLSSDSLSFIHILHLTLNIKKAPRFLSRKCKSVLKRHSNVLEREDTYGTSLKL